MQAVQRIKREKRMDGGKEKEEVDDPHTSAAKQKRPLRIGAELLLAERPSCSCVAACIRHYFPRQGRRLEPRWRASREFHPSEVLSEAPSFVATAHGSAAASTLDFRTGRKYHYFFCLSWPSSRVRRAV